MDGVTLVRGVLRDEIAEALKEAILHGRLRPGQRLNEKQLADELKVSRAPLREAFWKLQEEGLITKLPNKGAVVTQLSPRDVFEAYTLRIALEGMAARLVAEKQSREAEISRLRQAHARLVEVGKEENVVTFIVADYEFHHTLWVLSGNQKLEQVLARLCTPLFGFAMIDAVLRRKPLSLQTLAMDHQPVLEAIESGPPDLAEQVMRDIISGFRETSIARPSPESDSINTSAVGLRH